MIAIFTETICKNGGGSQFAAINYAIGLKKLGLEPVLFTIKTPYAKEELAKYKLQCCFLRPLILPILTFDLIHAVGFIKLHQPKLIILNESFSTYWIGLICGKIFKIHTLAYFHTYYFKNHETKFASINKILEMFVILYLRLCFKFVDYFAVPSKTAAIFLNTKLGIKKTKTQIYPYPILNKTNIKTKVTLKNKLVLNLLYTGRVVKGKNVDLLVKTLARIPTNNWTLTIIGSGRSMGEVARIIKNCHLENRIKIRDFLPRGELLMEYANYDVFISLSDMETLGFTYIEALNAGLPIICLKYPTTEELFTNLENVYFLKTKDPKSLAVQISEIIKLIKSKNAPPTQKDFLEQYTYTSAAQKLVSRWF
ncbi:glycosyltransferase family 4 protein [candidate division WWE3 bacterium]|nr:glycosyltransferase family 4 protein [candidate division WWE3 bacterium]